MDRMRAYGMIFCAAFAAAAAAADAGMVARARADLVQTARLDLRDSAPGRNRVGEPARTDLEQVIARYSQTIMVHPADDNAYFRRGIANLYAGSVAKARADIAKASELDPHYPYYELWLHLIDQRQNQPSRLGEALSRFEMTKWPAPLMRLFLGQAMVPEVLAAANDPDADTRRGQLCEANFYIAQLALKQGAKGEAMRLFRLAATDCPRDFVEGPAAGAELTAMSKDQSQW
jgi:lipoprotein NlpI